MRPNAARSFVNRLFPADRGTDYTARAVILSFALAGFFLAPAPVRAGFEFVPPAPSSAVPMHNMNEQMDMVPPMAAMPASRVDAAPLMPPAPMGEGSLGMMPMPMPSSPVQQGMDGGEFAAVEGFGRDMPLALVMQQLVPDHFAYSFDPGIDPGLRVDWDGGRAWDNVLDDALRAHNLQARVQNGTVRVMALSSAPLMQVASPAPSTPTALPSDAPMPLLSEAPAPAPAPDMAQEERPSMLNNMWSSVRKSRDVDSEQIEKPIAKQDTIPAGQIVPDISETPETPPAILFTRADNLGEAWRAARGDSLHDTLHRWAAQAGVVLFWNAAEDFRLPNAIDASGGFTQAVEQILALYAPYDDRPVGRLYNQPGGAPVLIVDYYAGATATN